MADAVSEQKQLDLAEKATKGTEVFNKIQGGQHKNIFDENLSIFVQIRENIKDHCINLINGFVEVHQNLPELPQLQTLKNELYQRSLQHVSKTLNTNTKSFENSLDLGKWLNYDGEKEISQKIAQMIIDGLRAEGIDDDRTPTEYHSNYVFSTPVSQPVQIPAITTSQEVLLTNNGSDAKNPVEMNKPPANSGTLVVNGLPLFKCG